MIPYSSALDDDRKIIFKIMIISIKQNFINYYDIINPKTCD